MSHLHEDDDNDHRHDVISPQNHQLPHHHDQLNVHPPDLDFFHLRRRLVDLIPSSIPSLDRMNQVNSVIDMFHQRVPQLQSQSHSASRIFRVIEENWDNNDIISNEFEAGLGLGFRLENYDNPNYEDDDNSADDFSVWTRERHGARSESGDSDDAGENEIIHVADCEEEASFHLCWDAFHLEDDIDITTSNPNLNSNANDDFEWEEVDDRTDEREISSMFFGAESDDDASVLPVLLTDFEDPNEQHQHEHDHDALEWQVLSNVNNFEPNPDSEDQYDEYNYTEYEMFFGQFADSDVVSSSGRPPASKTVVDNLLTVVVTQEDVVKENSICAVCKDEVVVGEMATRLPCDHRFHGDCILPWLAIRNTCPVCRHELPTDDLDYERRKAERAGLV